MQLIISTFDYIFLIGLLLIFLGIGIYFGIQLKKGSNTLSEYLIGSRNINVIPVSISLITSQISVITILTLPVEIYRFGLHELWSNLALYLILPIISFIIIPIFYDNKIWNCFEYLEKRFDSKTRNLVTGAFIIKVYLMLPILIFIPSLLFSQLTNINIHLINGIVCCICVSYTMLGGVKAVIWTQVLQGLIIFITIIVIILLILLKNDFGEIFKRANNGGRLYATNFRLDFTTRATLWNTLIGGSFGWFSFFGFQPITIQRISSVKSIKDARTSIIIFAVGSTIFSLMLYFIGISIYSRFYQCDPLKAGITNDLIALFIEDLIENSRIIPGLYIGCLFCAAMSTMSANLNNISGIIYCHYFTEIDDSMNFNNKKQQNNEKRSNSIMKTIIIVTGIYSILGGLLIEKFNWIIKIVMTASGVTQCIFAGLFLFGILYPKGIGDAAFRATYFSIFISIVIQFGNLLQKTTGLLHDSTLPMSIENCTEFNITYVKKIENFPDEDEAGPLFKISFYWYSFIASFIIWFLGIPWSKLMSYKKVLKKINPMLMSSLVTKWIPETMLMDETQKEFEMETINICTKKLIHVQEINMYNTKL